MSLIERAAAKAAQAKKKSAEATSQAEQRPSQTDAGAPAVLAAVKSSAPAPSLIDRAVARSQEDAASVHSAQQPAPKVNNRAQVAFDKPVETSTQASKNEEASLHVTDTPATSTPEAANVAAKAPRKRKKLAPVEDVDIRALRRAGYITPDAPPSLMSEEMRLIKRTLLLNAFGKGRKKIEDGNLILITSSNPGEGKTFFSLNLALSIALEKDVTVLLVDADFSKPEVLNRLGISGGKGLLDVVADKSLDISDCLVRTSLPNLVVLPAGRQHHQATELLASERMASIMREIGTRYPDRVIIFDSPPVLASSAASVLALYMGQSVFVIEAEKTTEPQIKESLNIISGCPHISLMLNKSRFETSHKKFASYYGYGGR